MSGPRISTARRRIALVVEQHVGRVEVDLQIGALQIVERPPQQIGSFLARLESDGDAARHGQVADSAKRVEERLAVRIARLRQEAGVQRQVGQAERTSALQGPLQALQTLRPQLRVAEAAALLDRLRRRVVLAGEAEHGAGQTQAGLAPASGMASPSSQAA